MASGQTGQVNHSSSLAWPRMSPNSEPPISVIFHWGRPSANTSTAATAVTLAIVAKAPRV
ncbi:Uncharacterised protein [Mycobacterium tuberculosis]|nr:Uncharacterised protein [Mycobacterium tuberculosis]